MYYYVGYCHKSPKFCSRQEFWGLKKKGLVSMRAKKMSSRFLGMFMALAMLVGILPIESVIDVSAASSGFHVSGTQILDANNMPFVMRGVNIGHAWLKDQYDTKVSIESAAKLGCNTLRIALSDGNGRADMTEKWERTTAQEVQEIIDLCKANKVVAVLEIQDPTGSNDTWRLDSAVNLWVEFKDILNANKDYVILNIANEWYGSWGTDGWADGYKSAVKTLRDAGIENMLMVDAAGWGQYPQSINEKAWEVAGADELKNTVFSIHMYEYAGGSSQTVKDNIWNALQTGYPVVIGEFGFKHSNGDVDEATIMSYCREMNVGYMGWSWIGNGGGVEYLDIAKVNDGSQLSSDWGEILFNSENGIKATSTLCSVYTGIIDESQVVPDDSKTEALPGDTQTVMAINGGNIDAVKISGNDGYKDGDFLNGGDGGSIAYGIPFTVDDTSDNATYKIEIYAQGQGSPKVAVWNGSKSEVASASITNSNWSALKSTPTTITLKGSELSSGTNYAGVSANEYMNLYKIVVTKTVEGGDTPTPSAKYEVVGPYKAGTVSVNGNTFKANVSSSRDYKFVGWYSDEACTNLVTSDASVSEADGTLYAKFDYVTYNLPIIDVVTSKNNGSVMEAFPESAGKSTKYKESSINITNTEGSLIKDVPQVDVVDETTQEVTGTRDMLVEIRGRGNSTWMLEKRPFRLDFEKKINLLQGGGTSKKWILLANQVDRTLLRNQLALDWARTSLTNIPFTTDTQPVEFYLNGEYMGVYLLVEQSEVATGRVEITKPEANTGNIDEIGFLLERDNLAENNGVPQEDYYVKDDTYGELFTIKTGVFEVEDANGNLTDTTTSGANNTNINALAIQQYISKVSAAIKSGNQSAIESYVDMPSLVDMFILQEFTKNCDVGGSSFYMSKDAGAGAKLVFNPPWDFDKGFGNDTRGQDPTGLYSANSSNDNVNKWFNALWSQNWFRELVKTRWAELRSNTATNPQNLLTEANEFTTEYADSLNRNFDKWNVLNKTYGWNGGGYGQYYGDIGPQNGNTYDGQVSYLTTWIRNRVFDLDDVFEYESAPVSGEKLTLNAADYGDYTYEDRQTNIAIPFEVKDTSNDITIKVPVGAGNDTWANVFGPSGAGIVWSSSDTNGSESADGVSKTFDAAQKYYNRVSGTVTVTIPAGAPTGTYYIGVTGGSLDSITVSFANEGDVVAVGGAVVEEFTVTASANDDAMGTAAPATQTVEKDGQATVTATPNDGYEFVNWTVNGEEVATTPDYAFTVTENVDLVANFKAVEVQQQYTVTVKTNNDNYGTVTGAGTYNEGESVTLTATPKKGYKFEKWLINGADVFSQDYAFNITSNVDATAYFNKDTSAEDEWVVIKGFGDVPFGADWSTDHSIQYDLTGYVAAKIVIEGTVNEMKLWLRPNDGNPVVENATVNGTYTYEFTEADMDTVEAILQGKDDGSGTITKFTIYGIPGEVVKYTVSASVAEECAEMGTVTGTKEYKEGALATVKATPANGYKFVKWVDEAGKEYTKSSHTFTVSEDKSFTAYFEKKAGSETTKTDTVRIEAEGATLFNNNAHQTKPGDTWYGEASANDWLEMTGSCEAYLPIVITDTSVTYDITFRYVAEGEDKNPWVNIWQPGEGSETTTIGGETYSKASYHQLGTTTKWGTQTIEGVTFSEPGTYYIGLFGEQYAGYDYVEVKSSEPVFEAVTVVGMPSSEEQGTVTGGGNVLVGSDVTLTARAKNGYKFVNWTLNGEEVGRSRTLVIENVSENQTYVANYKKIRYTIYEAEDFIDFVSEKGDGAGAVVVNNETADKETNDDPTFSGGEAVALTGSSSAIAIPFAVGETNEEMEIIVGYDYGNYSETKTHNYGDGSTSGIDSGLWINIYVPHGTDTSSWEKAGWNTNGSNANLVDFAKGYDVLWQRLPKDTVDGETTVIIPENAGAGNYFISVATDQDTTNPEYSNMTIDGESAVGYYDYIKFPVEDTEVVVGCKFLFTDIFGNDLMSSEFSEVTIEGTVIKFNPKVPRFISVQGYTLAGWEILDTDGNTLAAPIMGNDADKISLDLEKMSFEAGSTIVFKAIYEVPDDPYTLTVTNGRVFVMADETDIDYTYELPRGDTYKLANYTQVKLVAPDTNAYGSFQYWTLNGMVYSYDSTIFFSAWCDGDFEAVYAEEEVTVTPAAFISDNVQEFGFETTDVAFHKITFNCAFYIPENVEFVSAGIIFTPSKANIEDLSGVTVSGTSLANMPAMTAVSTARRDQLYADANNQVLMSLTGMKNGVSRYARSFLIYKEDGEYKVVFSEGIAGITTSQAQN